MMLDRYILKQLTLSVFFVAVTLVLIILLTQSLRFLDIILSSGASSASFLMLTGLALPRFIEVILPLATMIGAVFIYNKMSMDSELVAARTVGYSAGKLARPALIFATLMTMIVFYNTMFLTPKSRAMTDQMNHALRSEYSTLLLREGVFNHIGKNLTVFLENKAPDGALEGLIIHDNREELKQPLTVTAKKGLIVTKDGAEKVLVFDGARQDINPKTGALNLLKFERYSIELPEEKSTKSRWKGLEERSFSSLLNPDLSNPRDREFQYHFLVEIHRRIITPFLTLTFTAISLAFLLLGPVNRRGQNGRIVLAVASVVLLQGLYLGVHSLANDHVWGLLLMYGIVLIPLAIALFFLSRYSEELRRHAFFTGQAQTKGISQS